MSSALSASLRARAGALELDVELRAVEGTLVLVGPNGAGKSTLLSVLLGALPCEQGRITLGGDVLLDTARGVAVPMEERRIAWLPQDYALFPHLSARDNVAFALQSAHRRSRAEALSLANTALQELGVLSLAERRPAALSGGEQQRVALARALAVKPRALLLDEPLAALDVGARREVRGFLKDTLARLGLPTLVVTHDAADVRALGGRVVVLERGRVVQTGSWQELCARPATAFVEALVAA
ncbi:MAG: ABC transporter ATP-binding protein [Deltaproteobacteria bacterium]|nr:ABC transporter ATP-binding protein [Deltaproteobacteria bacterium]